LQANLSANARDLISSVKKDPYAIGFCRLSDVIKAGLNELEADVMLLPIDRNGNGRIDNFENIYSTPHDLSRGVWIGKYPHALSRPIYAQMQKEPTDKNTLAFLTWITTEGGQYMPANGYSGLINLEKQANLAALVQNSEEELTDRSLAAWPWLTILVCVIAGAIMIAILTGNNSGMRSLKHEKSIPLPLS
jgi:hypothetical protein